METTITPASGQKIVHAPHSVPNPTSLLQSLGTDWKKQEKELRDVAERNEWLGLSRTINLARVFHKGQLRKTGEPFAAHVIRVTHLLHINGVRVERILTAALLHDAIEDCPHLVSAKSLRDTHGFHPRVVSTVELLTKTKKQSYEVYCARVAISPEACLIKLADRLDNLKTIPAEYSLEKLRRKLDETERCILPLYTKILAHVPEYAEIAGRLTRNVTSLLKMATVSTHLAKKRVRHNARFIEIRTCATEATPQ